MPFIELERHNHAYFYRTRYVASAATPTGRWQARNIQGSFGGLFLWP